MFDFKEQIKKDREFIDGVWEKLDKKMSVVAVRSREKCPYTSKELCSIKRMLSVLICQ